MKITYSIADVEPYINWAYYYFAWQVKQADERSRMKAEATAFLHTIEPKYHTYALFELCDAYSEGDDIVCLCGDEQREEHIPCLRQQQEGSEYLCLSDYIAPRHSTISDNPSTRIGLFATSVDIGMETDFDHDPYQKMMAQLLADRLAEATAERLHEQVRKTLWGYAPDEQLSMDEMQQEHFQGIRPAVGYPSLPDASLNFVLDGILDFSQIGITLTENGAMRPHASVSGLMMAHPESRYFNVGKIGVDQLADYARRRHMSLDTARKFLISNL